MLGESPGRAGPWIRSGDGEAAEEAAGSVREGK